MNKKNVFKFTALIITIFIGIFIYFQYFIMEKYFEENIRNEQNIIKNAYEQKMREVQLIYSKRMITILSIPIIKNSIISGDREELKNILIKKFNILKKENKYINTMLITDTNNIVVLRAHKPKIYGDDLSTVRPIIKAANKEKKTFFGFEAGKMSIPYRITMPIIYDGIHYGVLDVGVYSNVFLNYINSISSNAQMTYLMDKKLLEKFIKKTDIDKIPMKRNYLVPEFNDFFLPFFDKINFSQGSSQINCNDKNYLINTNFKIDSFDGTPFGTILVAYDISSKVGEENKKMLFVFLFILLYIFTIYSILKYSLKHYEKDLKEEKKAFEVLFQNSTDGILLMKDNRFIECNDAIVRMLKYKNKTQILNTHPSELSPKKQPDGEDSFSKAERMIKIAKDNSSNIFEWVHQKSDGEEIWCEVALTSMHINNEDIIHTRWRDITALKDVENITKSLIEQKTAELKVEMQNAKDANRSKSEFLANMSHEIRTPLNAIMGFIDLLKEEESDADKQKYLKTVDASSHNLLEIINDILDFSKIESNQIYIENREFNTEDEFDSISELFYAKSKEKNIELKIEIQKTIPKHLNSDILRIKQVIINLISNAIKFTDANKSVELNISYADNMLSVSVKDEGIGIAKDKLKTIFEAFTQADNSTTRKYGGTGLGLTIGHKLIKALGGELKVNSQENVGSEFYFSIPVKEVAVKTQEDILKEDRINLSGHILLVEDNEANQMFMKVILKKMGFTFDIAFNGLEALERFPKITCEGDKRKYDVILMDENMPNMNGIEATKRILSIEKELNLPHTPIIALTANAIKGDRERFLAAGMDEYMTKPVNKRKLGKVLERFLMKGKN